MAKSTGKVREFCQSGKVGTLSVPIFKNFRKRYNDLFTFTLSDSNSIPIAVLRSVGWNLNLTLVQREEFCILQCSHLVIFPKKLRDACPNKVGRGVNYSGELFKIVHR